MTEQPDRGTAAGRLIRMSRVKAPVPELAPGRRPRVSVIIPCYNYAHFLPESVGSALSQAGVEVEVIVVDDASTDDSAEVAARFAAADPRVKALRNPANAGHVVTFNNGLAAATGEFIVRLDADDLLTPGSLGRAVALFDAYPSVGLVYGHPRHFTTEVPPEPRTTMRGWSLWSGRAWVGQRCRTGVNCITTPEAVIRASVLKSIGGLDTRLRYAQDMEMWLRTAAVSDVGRVDGPDQALHRDHENSMSVNEGGTHLLDLQERRTVFEVLFDGPGRRLGGAPQLHQLARRALASEALVAAYHSYDRGRANHTNVDEYVEFALATLPEARQLPQWRALARRQRVGERLAPAMPPFAASVVWRRVRWEVSHRKWERTGIY